MLLNGGKDLIFKINAEPDSIEGWTDGIHLRCLGMEELGLKMSGDFPILWETDDDEVDGPELYDDDDQYKVMKVDYENSLIWLFKM